MGADWIKPEASTALPTTPVAWGVSSKKMPSVPTALLSVQRRRGIAGSRRLDAGVDRDW